MMAYRARKLLQACAVPFRLHETSLEFCLITSIGKRRWGFPKGIVEPNETDAQAALKEALEEAGIEGRILGEPLHEYADHKWDMELRVVCFLMEVETVHEAWQEADLRRRRWASADDALRMVSKAGQLQALGVGLRRLSGIVRPDGQPLVVATKR